MMIDIDHFKKINDTYGHASGDEVIVSVADSLRSCTRESDLVARLGGEEYVVMMINCDNNLALKLSERIRKDVESKIIVLNEQSINVTVSIGVEFMLGYDDPIDKILSRADEKLYHAKEQGRNRIVIDMH